MTANYQEIIEAEQLRIKQLENELAQRRTLLQALLTVKGNYDNTTPQPKSEASTTAPEPPQKTEKKGRLPAYIRKESLPLLRSIKDQALSADAIALFCRQVGVNIDREAVLFRLGLYRRNYAMVQTVSHGLYQLTEKGRRYLDERYPEAGSSAAHHQTDESVNAKTALPDLFPLGRSAVP